MAKPIDPLIDDFGDPDRSPRAGLLQRLAHLLPWAVAVLSVASVLRWFNAVPWLLSGWVFYAFYLPVLFVVASSGLHVTLARMICLKCMAAVRADAPVRVQRHRWQLWVHHQLSGFRFAAAVLAAGGMVWLVRHLTGLTDAESPWLLAPGDVVILLAVWSEWIHHRYRPWCPYCKDWGEDGHIHEPSPNPDPSMEKTR